MKYHIIAIEREYASGGQEIGEKLATRMGIPCYGREILELAAKELGTSTAYLEGIEEKSNGSFLFSMYTMAGLANMAKGGNGTMSNEGALFLTESEIIRKITQTPAVIVGRCAVDALKDREDVLRVFIRSSNEKRHARAIDSYGISPDNAESVIRRADKRRNSYYKVLTGKDWRDAANYHLVLDSGSLGIDKCVELLELCVR